MDHALLILLNRMMAHPALDTLMLLLTIAGPGLWAGLGAVLIAARQQRVGGALVASLAASLVLVMILQYLALRSRPEHVRLLLPMPNFPSYPSGHAAAGFAAAMVLVLAYQRPALRVSALVGAGLISLSRVYLGHHFPSDILGGAVLGAGVAASCFGLVAAPGSGQPAWRWLLWTQVALVFVVTQMAYLRILPAHLLDWPWSDKVLHFLLFGAIAFWANLWLRNRALHERWPVPLAVLLPFTLASVEEFAQHFSPARTASLADLACDLAGMLVFWRLSRVFLRH